MYYNIKKMNGKIKGDFGELMFVSLKKYAHWTRYDSHHWLKKIKSVEIPDSILKFLKENWGTIDVFELVHDKNHKIVNLILYEVKTTSYYNSGINDGKKICATNNEIKVYNSAREKGFIVKLVDVILFDYWRFKIRIRAFDEKLFFKNDGNPKYAKNF